MRGTKELSRQDYSRNLFYILKRNHMMNVVLLKLDLNTAANNFS